ncbi:hypothetical protein HPB50_028422 [Hyalomma asiaticum]|nr:hypothetical protein HPB50_028422 [Hyalomma asiaticum]
MSIDTAEDCLDGQEAASSSTQHELPRSSECSPAQLASQESQADPFEHLAATLRHFKEQVGNDATCLKHVARPAKKLERLPSKQTFIEAVMIMSASVSRASRCQGRIHVQPTSTSRRRPGLNKGSNCVPPGRPPKSSASKKAKRSHSLRRCIEENVSSAR